MARKFAEMRPGCPQVSLQDIMVAAACAHNRLVPRNGADASLMPLKVSDQFAVLSVPDLCVA